MTIRYGARHEDLVGSGSGSTDAWALSLLATYETDPEIGPAVLPRPLEATGEPWVNVNISQVEMASGARFGAADINVPARHGDVLGRYALALPMSAEAAVIGGRETFGEPKKLADIRLERNGDELHGNFMLQRRLQPIQVGAKARAFPVLRMQAGELRQYRLHVVQ